MIVFSATHAQEMIVSQSNFVASKTAVWLGPAPINPDWIRDGVPVARCAELSRSPDGMAMTLVWECSPGTFDWFYDLDETLYVLEGDVILDEGRATERRIGPGDTVFFPAGSQAHWRVKSPIRKLAFVRRAWPRPFALLFNLLRKIKHRR